MVIKQKSQIKRNENQVTSRDGTGLREIWKVYKVKWGQKYTGRERRKSQRKRDKKETKSSDKETELKDVQYNKKSIPIYLYMNGYNRQP